MAGNTMKCKHGLWRWEDILFLISYQYFVYFKRNISFYNAKHFLKMCLQEQIFKSLCQGFGEIPMNTILII